MRQDRPRADRQEPTGELPDGRRSHVVTPPALGDEPRFSNACPVVGGERHTGDTVRRCIDQLLRRRQLGPYDFDVAASFMADLRREPFANPRNQRLAEITKRGPLGLIADAVHEEDASLVCLHTALPESHCPPWVSMLALSASAILI